MAHDLLYVLSLDSHDCSVKDTSYPLFAMNGRGTRAKAWSHSQEDVG